MALAPFDPFASVISALPSFETVWSDWESMMTTLRLNPPARLGAHLLAQQRIPYAAQTPAGKGVVNLFPRRIVLGQRALLATDSQWFGRLWLAHGRWR